jgi:hypothetical protein
LVEHHLAKVRVAGSNPVVRSKLVIQAPFRGCLFAFLGMSALSFRFTISIEVDEMVPRVSGHEAFGAHFRMARDATTMADRPDGSV